MQTIQLAESKRPRSAAPQSGPYPWESTHAAVEDKALGLELELIELVRRRNDIADATDPDARILDAEIDWLLAELGQIGSELNLSA